MIKRNIIVALVIVASCVGQLVIGSQASAADPSEFNAGRIIDDELFYNKDDMSAAAIQSFLDAHVPACDTWGTGYSGYGSLTKAQYAQQILGWSGPPYTCLNNYYENPTTGATSFENGGGSFAGGLSAAQIIYNAAQQYGINPKVLLVILRKESKNLFGDSWPLKSQYTYAMGYDCPDSGPNYSANCNPTKAGFYKQMTYAAKQFRLYYDNMGSYNYAPGRWNTILYSTDPACGTKEVYIQNYATASLYIYTPYTPNDAALYAFPGQAPCGAYGNRNFWFMWQEWFGSTLTEEALVSVTSGLGFSPNTEELYQGETVRFSYVVKNNSSQKTITIGNASVCARRLSDGKNLDLPWVNNISIAPKQTWTFEGNFSAPTNDSYVFWICNWRASKGFSDNFPMSQDGNIVRTLTKNAKVAPTVVTSLSAGNGEVVAGKPFTMTFAVKNNDTTPIRLGSILVAGRGVGSSSRVDFPYIQDIVIQPGQTYTYSASGIVADPGKYRMFISTFRPGYGWNEQFPASATPTTQREIVLHVQPNPRMSESLQLGTMQPVVGQTFSARFVYRNDSPAPVKLGSVVAVAVGPTGKKEYFPFIENITIPAGQSYVYSQNAALTMSGKYRIFASVLMPNSIWNEAYPTTGAGITRDVLIDVGPNPSISTSIAPSSAEVVAGKPFGITFSIKNSGSSAVTVGKPLVAIRNTQTGSNNDFTLEQTITIQPGQTYTYDKQGTINTPGKYRAFVSVQRADGSWDERYPLATPTTQREIVLHVQPNPRMSESLQLGTMQPVVGQTFSARFVYRNDSPAPVKLGSVVAVAVGPTGKKEYFPFIENITIPAGQSYVYSQNAALTMSGKYRIFASVLMPNSIWNEAYPTTGAGITRDVLIDVGP